MAIAVGDPAAVASLSKRIDIDPAAPVPVSKATADAVADMRAEFS